MNDIGNITYLQHEKCFLDFLKIMKSALTSFLHKAIGVPLIPMANIHFLMHTSVDLPHEFSYYNSEQCRAA